MRDAVVRAGLRVGVGFALLSVGFATGCGESTGRGGGAWYTAGGASADDGEDGDSEGFDDDDGAGSLTAADDDAGGDGDDDDDDRPRPDDDDDDDDHGETGGDDDDDDDETGGDPIDPPGGDDCPEHCYCEPFDPEADVGDLIANYSAANWENTVFEFMARRWPAGGVLLMDMSDDWQFGSYSDKSSFDMAIGDGLPTEAHEMTHGWDFGHATVSDFAYFVRGDLQYFPPKMDGFPRSEIYSMIQNSSTDLYKDLYLTGTQGSYGFNDVLDEGNCYIHDMATYAVAADYMPWAGISGRDGAVAFMYYLELYLKQARTAHPDFYAQIKGIPDYVELVQTQWLRMHFFLQFADEHPELGINDMEIRQLMYQDQNQSEIEMFIDHELEASNCLPQ